MQRFSYSFYYFNFPAGYAGLCFGNEACQGLGLGLGLGPCYLHEICLANRDS